MMNFFSPFVESYNELKNFVLAGKVKILIREANRLNRKFLCLDNLNLTNEDLEVIIPVIEEDFPDIEILGLAQNNLDRLPDSLANLKQLKKLNLSLNNLTDIPNSILGLPDLTEVHLYNNPLSLKFLFEISSEVYSEINFTFHNSDREFLQKKQEEPSNTFRNVVLFLAEIYPDVGHKKISALFDRLNNYQKEVVDAFKNSLTDVGVSFENGDFSDDLNLAHSEVPLFIELLEKAYEIEDITEMTFLEAVNLVKTKPEYLQGIIDFGLTVNQMDRLTSKGRDFLKGVYEILAEKIQDKYYSDNEDEFDVGELSNEDKALARTTVNSIITQHNLDKIVIADVANKMDALGIQAELQGVENFEAMAVAPNPTQGGALRRRKKTDKQDEKATHSNKYIVTL